VSAASRSSSAHGVTAQLTEVATVPVRIKNLTDGEVLQARLIENLQRRDVHPVE
jgi:ParB family chromosome partitioning protein